MQKERNDIQEKGGGRLCEKMFLKGKEPYIFIGK